MHTTLSEFELSVGAVRPLLNTLFCMWAWQLNLLLALPAKQAWLASSWKILVEEVFSAQEDWTENHSSRRSILLVRWRLWHQNFQLTRQLNLLATYCDDVCGFCVGWLITVMFTLYCLTALATCADTNALWNRAYIMFTHIRTVISAHMSNTLDQILVDKTWSPMVEKWNRKYSRVHLSYRKSSHKTES